MLFASIHSNEKAGRTRGVLNAVVERGQGVVVIDQDCSGQLLRRLSEHLERLWPRDIVDLHIRVLGIRRQQILDECGLACTGIRAPTSMHAFLVI